MTKPYGHALVMGASMGGLLAARALSDHFARVTILERDTLPTDESARAGVPQARHVHALLARGYQTLETFFPGIGAALDVRGAINFRWGADMKYLSTGGWVKQFDTGIASKLLSRSLLESEVRRRVLALPNVSAIEPNPPNSPKATLRQKIEAHRNNANCAACHAKIDPLGIAWDNYDAIGQWRTREKVAKGLGEDPLIDPSGVMPDGRPFKDSVEFKKVLLEDRDKIAKAFIEHLCTYALRRVLTIDDQDDIKAIVSEAKKNQYRVRDIVRAVALSDLMRKR